MTILTPPTWLENSALHNAQDYRTLLASLVAGRSGIATDAAFEVTEKSGTPDMSVDVAAGGLFVASTRASSAGVYHVYNDGVVNVPLSAADATNDRIDRVLVQVRDEEQDAALTQNDARIYVVEGTPAASPTLPTITVEDYVELAQVTVPASATSITDSDIDDVRGRAVAVGGVTPCTSATRPSSPQTGEVIWESDTGDRYAYTGSAWAQIGTDNQVVIAGTHSDSVSSSAGENASISFPVTFDAPPVVTCQIESTSTNGWVTQVHGSPTTSGFTYRILTRDGSSVSASYKIHWIAVGKVSV